MRDPGRIDGLLETIGRAMKRSPDLRLGQLVCILAGRAGCDPFYIEDGRLVQEAEAFLTEIERHRPPTQELVDDWWAWA